MTRTAVLKAKGPWWEISPYVRSREAFKTHGALSATAYGMERGKSVNFPTIGQLPPEFEASVRRASYIVYSYRTPIAWFVPCACNGMSFIANRWVFTGECSCKATGWHMPDVHYSQTTSAHQGKIRTALSEFEVRS